MKKLYFLSAATLLFIVVNLVLVLKLDKIDRTVWVQEPYVAEKGTLKDQLPTEGEVIPSEEDKVFFEPQRGILEEVLVKEGQEVEEGTPLVSYEGEANQEKITSLEQANERLDIQIEKLNDDIAILQSDATNTQTNTPIQETELNDEKPRDDTHIREYEIKDKEYEIRLLELQKETNQKEIDAEISKDEGKTITSKISGIVAETNEFGRDEKTPLITIHNFQPNWVKVHVLEEEIQKIKTGQEVILEAEYIKAKKLNGTILAKGNMPIHETKKDEQSIYEVTIQVSDDIKPILSGLHVKGHITIREVEDIIIVPKDSVRDQKVVLMDKGRLYPQNITLGMTVNDQSAILNGVKLNERILPEADLTINGGTAFITPAAVPLTIDKSLFKRFTVEENLLLLARGMFQ